METNTSNISNYKSKYTGEQIEKILEHFSIKDNNEPTITLTPKEEQPDGEYFTIYFQETEEDLNNLKIGDTICLGEDFDITFLIIGNFQGIIELNGIFELVYDSYDSRLQISELFLSTLEIIFSDVFKDLIQENKTWNFYQALASSNLDLTIESNLFETISLYREINSNNGNLPKLNDFVYFKEYTRTSNDREYTVQLTKQCTLNTSTPNYGQENLKNSLCYFTEPILLSNGQKCVICYDTVTQMMSLIKENLLGIPTDENDERFINGLFAQRIYEEGDTDYTFKYIYIGNNFTSITNFFTYFKNPFEVAYKLFDIKSLPLYISYLNIGQKEFDNKPNITKTLGHIQRNNEDFYLFIDNVLSPDIFYKNLFFNIKTTGYIKFYKPNSTNSTWQNQLNYKIKNIRYFITKEEYEQIKQQIDEFLLPYIDNIEEFNKEIKYYIVDNVEQAIKLPLIIDLSSK